MSNPFESDQDYENALSRAYDLMQMELIDGSPESVELDNLTTRIAAYESEHYPIDAK